MHPKHLVASLVLAGAAFLAAPGAARAQPVEVESMFPTTIPLTVTQIANPIASVSPTAQALLNVRYHIPPTAETTGVAYFFHGGSGNSTNWTDDEEQAALLVDLVRDGYGVVCVESSYWTTTTNAFATLRSPK